jgi:hypothetical protein
MNLRLQISIILIGFILLFSILKMVQRGRLELKYGMLWITTSLVFVLMAAFPGIASLLAGLIGIQEPTNAVFLILILFELVINLSLTLAISKQTSKVKSMAQFIALMDNHNPPERLSISRKCDFKVKNGNS